jgi:hypothetical protein
MYNLRYTCALKHDENVIQQIYDINEPFHQTQLAPSCWHDVAWGETLSTKDVEVV